MATNSTSSILQNLISFRIGLILSLLTLLFGFVLGIMFGANEDGMKEALFQNGVPKLAEYYDNDTAKLDALISKSWTYFKRAHLHANGLGTTSLVLIILLSTLGVQPKLSKIASIFLGAGALFYSLYWLVAGWYAPVLGSTKIAKESLNWLAMPSAGGLVVGLILLIYITIYATIIKQTVASKS